MTPIQIIATVAEDYGVTVAELLSHRRPHRLVVPRFTAVLIVREHCKLSYPALGRLFDRDHSSAHHAYQVAYGWLLDDPDYRNRIESLGDRICSTEEAA